MESGCTALGTPASPKWDAGWVAEVERVETELGRRICGAHTPAWTPCRLASTHANGRCRFHGGHPNIGAPDGNRNAWVHGLYSRRLQHCGDHCPLWNHCPMAGKDVLDLKPSERPHCVYEQQEYESLLSAFSLEKEKAEPIEIDSETGLIARNVALFQVMLSRAQAALGIARFTDDTRAYTLNSNYRMQTTKVGALVQAQLSIARELRQWLKLLPGFDPKRAAATATPAPPTKPEPEQGLPMRMLKVLEETEGFLETALGLAPGEKCAFSPRLNKRKPVPNTGPI